MYTRMYALMHAGPASWEAVVVVAEANADLAAAVASMTSLSGLA